MSVEPITSPFFEVNKIHENKYLTQEACPVCANNIEKISSDNKSDDNKYLYTKGITSLAILNGPTDVEDLFSAWKQIKSGFKDYKPDGYDMRVAQHPFSFFRGTILHEYLNPNSEKCINQDLAKKIITSDVSLGETKFGTILLDWLGVEEVNQLPSKVESLIHTHEKPDYVIAKEFRAKNAFGELTARALLRTPKYSCYTLAWLESLEAIYDISRGEDFYKTLAKTILEVSSTIIGVGYLGAIGYKYFGPVGSFAGMGAGTVVGQFVPNYAINK